VWCGVDGDGEVGCSCGGGCGGGVNWRGDVGEAGGCRVEGAAEDDLMAICWGAGDWNCECRWKNGEVGEESSNEGEKMSGDWISGEGSCGAPVVD
jgi:hypothetical protein